MATLLVEALKGARAEVAQQQGLMQQLRRAGRLTGVLAQELRTAVSLSPFGVRAMRVRSALPTVNPAAASEAGTAAAAAAAAAAASPYGVVLYPAVPFGPQPRHNVDIYVPSEVVSRQHAAQSEQQQQEHRDAAQASQQQQQEHQQGLVPVVFFVHGGIWVTGERWHFCPMATRLAQAGLVVVATSYTLYPDALAGQMAAEVLAAYKWAAGHVAAYGGDPAAITVMGHSAGGHLGSLALLMLAQQKHEATQQQRHQAEEQQERQEWQQEQQQVQQSHQQRPANAGGPPQALQQQQQQQQTQAGRVPQIRPLVPAGFSNPSRTTGSKAEPHHHQAQQQQQQQQHQQAPSLLAVSTAESTADRHLPEQQLQQRTDIAEAEAPHRHHIHPDQSPVSPALQQQDQQLVMHQQQQQQQQLGLHWTATGQYVLSIPTPAAFIGMSSVYDVRRHFEFESLRGVAGISTMGRACGGAVNFNSISPASVLRRAAAAAAAAAAGPADAGSSSHGGGSFGSSVTHPEMSTTAAALGGSSGVTHPVSSVTHPDNAPVLAGEVIPYRSGLVGCTAAVGNGLDGLKSTGVPAQLQRQALPSSRVSSAGSSAQGSNSSSGSSSSSSAAGGHVPQSPVSDSVCSTSALLACLTAAAAAQHMPSCIIMSSLGDHMVPWHEGAEMFLALRFCGVPAKHLIYDKAQHNDFVLDWAPHRKAAAASTVSNSAYTAAVQGYGTERSADAASSVAGSAAGSTIETLPAFARDLLLILTGQVKVRFETGSSKHTAAAVAALERAAGLPGMQSVPLGGAAAVAAAKNSVSAQGVPLPLSKL